MTHLANYRRDCDWTVFSRSSAPHPISTVRHSPLNRIQSDTDCLDSMQEIRSRIHGHRMFCSLTIHKWLNWRPTRSVSRLWTRSLVSYRRWKIYKPTLRHCGHLEFAMLSTGIALFENMQNPYCPVWFSCLIVSYNVRCLLCTNMVFEQGPRSNRWLFVYIVIWTFFTL